MGLCTLALGAALLAGCAGGQAGDAGSGANAETGTAEPAATDEAEEAAAEPIWLLSHERVVMDGEEATAYEETYVFDEHGSRVSQTNVWADEDTPMEIAYEPGEDGYPVRMTSTSGGEVVLESVFENETDAEGRLVHRTGNGIDVTYVYDADGNLSEVTTLESGDGDYAPTTTVTTPDKWGNVVREDITSEGSTVTNEYVYELDDEGRPTSGVCTTTIDGDPDSAEESPITYEYDENGNLVRMTTGGMGHQFEVTYEYVQVSDPSPAALHFMRTLRV